MKDNMGKKAAGYRAADYIQNGMKVGLGTGSTVHFFIERLGELCRQGLKIQAVASSKASETLAKSLHIPLLPPETVTHLDITVDGADEIDSKKQMIKGGGGALLFEKILASSSTQMIVIVDESKVCTSLGSVKLPVEMIPFCYHTTLYRLHGKGFKGMLRTNAEGHPFETDGGHFIYDLDLPDPIWNAQELHQKIIQIPGVVETGLFFDIADHVIIGNNSGHIEIWS